MAEKQKAADPDNPGGSGSKRYADSSWFMSLIEDLVDEGVKMGAEGFAEAIFDKLSPDQKRWLNSNRWAIGAARVSRFAIKNSSIAGRGANEFVSDTAKHFQNKLNDFVQNEKQSGGEGQKGAKAEERPRAQAADPGLSGQIRLETVASSDRELRDNWDLACTTLTQEERQVAYLMAASMNEEQVVNFLKMAVDDIVRVVKDAPKQTKPLTYLELRSKVMQDAELAQLIVTLIPLLGEYGPKFWKAFESRPTTLDEFRQIIALPPEEVIRVLKLDAKSLGERVKQVGGKIESTAQQSGVNVWLEGLCQRVETAAGINPPVANANTQGDNQ